jgi:hypothetical protein
MHTHAHVRACRPLHIRCTNAHPHPHPHTHPHCTHTHEQNSTLTARAAECGCSRSAAETRRSIGPLPSGTRRRWRRCSRTAPTCTQRASAGAAAHWSPFWATVGVRRAAVADRDGVGAMYADENAHAHIDADARSIIITHTCTLTLTQTYISKCARTQPHTHKRFHPHARTDMQTHFHAPTGSRCGV